MKKLTLWMLAALAAVSTLVVGQVNIYTKPPLMPSTGSTTIDTLGTVTTGTWNADVVGPAYGGTGVANNSAATLTRSGNHALTVTTTATTGVTLPTTGTLSTLAGAEALTNKSLTAIRADLAKTAPAIAAGVITLNLALSNFFVVPLDANVTTTTVSNPAATGTVSSFILIYRADGTPRTLAWMSGATWINNGGAAPTPTSTSGQCDKYTWFTYDGGTTWYGTVDAQNFTCTA